MKRSRIRPVSAKQRAKWAARAKARRELVEERGRLCEIRSPVCWTWEQGVHHLYKASRGGCDHVRNLVLACNPCNGYVEDEPAWAKEHGWTLSHSVCCNTREAA